jgi:galactoside O-acetyltransferase
MLSNNKNLIKNINNNNIVVNKILLKKYSLVGCYTVILPSVTLEHATSVGAHSLVTKSTEPFDVVVGTPAKFIKKRKNVYLN